MKSRVRVMGHSVHQMLVVFPLGLLATSIVFDILYRISGDRTMAVVCYWLTAAGVIGGLLAAPFGLADWMSIPGGTRARRIGAAHALTNGAVLAVFTVSGLLRYSAPETPPMLASLISLLGGVVALVGGWLGGELVERLGVGVDEGANLNASSSLSGLPAGERAR